MLLSLHVNIKMFLQVRKHIVNMENKETDSGSLVIVFKEKRDERHINLYIMALNTVANKQVKI